ncbi:1883_t:CDS:2, partial [Funneliformis geosporum]
DIGDGNDIFDLKKAIKEIKQDGFSGVDVDRLRLWRVNAAQITSEILNKELEDAAQKIGEAFHGVQGNNVRVVVRTSDTEELRAKLAALCVKLGYELGYTPPVEELGLLVPLSETKFKQLKREKEYKETVNLGLKANPPSTSAKPSNFFSNQQKNPILNGRPLEHTGPPITIHNRTFGQFLEDFRNADLVVPSDIMEWVIDIISAVTDRYTIEDERMDTMREILSKKFGTISVISYERKGCKSDGILTTKVGIHDAIMVIFEGKNEVGSGGTDPSVQEAIYYRNYWSQSSADQIRDCCCAPSFIITIARPWFCVFRGVFLNRVVVQPLTDSIPLTIDLRNKDQGLELNQTGQQYFPYLRSFPINGKTVNFTYTEELANDHTRTIWKASTDNNKMIVVKFVTEYNRNAHDICHSKGYALELLYCSANNEIRALGGYKMIIMEHVSTSLDKKFNKIEIMHLRLPNILVYNQHGTQRAMLIDFDWYERHETDKYPPSLNMSIQWPTNVKPNAFLNKADDLYWLRKLQEYL